MVDVVEGPGCEVAVGGPGGAVGAVGRNDGGGVDDYCGGKQGGLVECVIPVLESVCEGRARKCVFLSFFRKRERSFHIPPSEIK